MKVSVILEALTGSFSTDIERAARRFDKDLKSIEQKAKVAGKAIAAAFVTGGTALAVLTKHSIDAADRLNKLSQSTGLSAKALSELQYAAGLSGVEDLGDALTKLNKSIGEAAQGSRAQSDAFKAIGISITNAEGSLKSTEELLGEVTTAFQASEDGVGKATVAMDLFGRSGASLIPFLNQGAGGLAKLREEAVALGLSISGDTAAAAEEFNDNLERLGKLADGVGNQLAANLLPDLVRVTDGLVDASKSQDLVRRTAAELTPVLEQLAIGVAVIGESAYAAAKLFRALGGSFEAVFADLKVLGTFIANGAVAGLAFEQGRQALSKALDERNEVVEKANNRYEDLWNYNGTFLSDALKKQFGMLTDYTKQVDDLVKNAAGLNEPFPFPMLPGFQREDPEVSVPLRPGFRPEKSQISLPPGTENSIRAAGDEAARALEQIQSLSAGLREQVETFGQSEEATIRYRIASGDLADVFARAGAAGEPFKQILIDLTQQLSEKVGATEAARRQDELAAKAQSDLEDLYGRNIDLITGLDDKTLIYLATQKELNKLFEGGRISADEQAKALARLADKLNEAGDAYDKLTPLAKKAAEAAEDALTDFLFNPFESGVEGMVRQFAAAMAQIAARALATQIVNAAISAFGGAASGAAGSAPSGGSHDYVGSGKAGMAYTIGTGAQPELFVPDTPGQFIPKNQWMQQSAPQINIKNVNAWDTAGAVGDFLQTSAGEKLILNAVRRNPNAVRSAVAV